MSSARATTDSVKPLLEVMPTARVFVRDIPAYLRFTDIAGNEKMVLVNCQGIQGTSTILSLIWTESANRVCAPPPLGCRLQCYTISDGVLFAVSGRFSGRIAGTPLQLDVGVEETCRGISLRRHARFDARGSLSLWRGSKALSSVEFCPQLLDVSQGGFGAVLPDGGWQPGEMLQFKLAFVPDPPPDNRLEFSVLDISGSAVVRKRMEDYGVAMVRIGCEFTEIGERDQRLLKLMLSTHGAAQRKG